MFVCYDIKGIQQFIFSVPRLKCIIAASSQIARFDGVDDEEGIVAEVAKRHECKRIFTGGGRGAISCESPAIAKQVRADLITEAHRLGLDIRIGVDEKFSSAALYADQLYPFVPKSEELGGPPCAESGLWPVPGSDGTKPHPLIEKRLEEGRPGNDFLYDYLFRPELNLLYNRVPTSVRQDYTVEFLRNVNPEEFGDDATARSIDQQRATAGSNALGQRNRWSIVVMDVNDMGVQFDVLEQEAESSGDQAEFVRKVRIVSEKTKQVTHRAFANALVHVMNQWVEKLQPDLDQCSYAEGSSRYLVLPFRPLVLGGDDIVLLCHSALAMGFVRKMSSEFTRLSEEVRDEVQAEHRFNPWPATDGRLTISAGVLFAKVTLPLHTAIPYAERLLKHAKDEYRRTGKSGPPTPAAVDWETATDTMVDTPSARRNRELRFIDDEIGAAVCLTRRPYLIDVQPNEKDETRVNRSLARLDGRVKQLAAFPMSFRSELKAALKKPWSGRTRFRISISKDPVYREVIGEALRESADGTARGKGNAWFVPHKQEDDGKVAPERDKQSGKQIQMTDFIDALLLLDEEHRMEQETAG